MAKKQFIVDDWGMSPAINEAALYLAEKGCLYGISVVPESRFYDYKLSEVLALGVQVGCHSNLTFSTAAAAEIAKSPWWEVLCRISTLVISCLWPSRRRRMFSILSQQLIWVQNHIGKVDYLDGHHHIHMYPGIFEVCQEICAKNQIPFRLVRDPSFKANFILSHWARWRAESREYFECRYLTGADLQNESTFLAKAGMVGEVPIVIHPSSRDDFKENQVRDHYSAQRVQQFNLIKRALGI